MDVKSDSGGDSGINMNVTPQEIMDVLQTRIRRQEGFNVKNKFDSLFILLHAIMTKVGDFHLVGLGEEGDVTVDQKLPTKWNQSNDAWVFRYKHSQQGSRTFLLKGLRLGDKLLVHAIEVNTENVCSIELNTKDYIKEDAKFDTTPVDFNNFYKNVERIIKEMTDNIIAHLLSVVKQQPKQEQPRREQQRYPDYRPQPYPDTRYRGEYGQPHPLGDFRTGDQDLWPGRGGLPSPGGGNLIGPNHPGFGSLDPYRGGGGDFPPPFPGGGGVGGGGRPPGIPPGARFDPYGPPINPRGGIPDHNELQPPGPPPGGYNNMFL